MNKFTEKFQEALQLANEIAVRNGHQQLKAVHLFKSFLEQQQGLLPIILQKLGLNLNNLASEVEAILQQEPAVSGDTQTYLSNELNQLLIKAKDEAKSLNDEFVSAEHFLLALIDTKSKITDALKVHGINKNKILDGMKQVRGNQRITSQNPENTFQALEKYGKDLSHW